MLNKTDNPHSVYKLMERDKQMTIQINNKLSGSDKFYGESKPYTFEFDADIRNIHLEKILQIFYKIKVRNPVYFFVHHAKKFLS